MQQDHLQESRSITGMWRHCFKLFPLFYTFPRGCCYLHRSCVTVSLQNSDDAADSRFGHPSPFSASHVLHLEPHKRGILQPYNSRNHFQGHRGITGSSEPWQECCSGVTISALKALGDAAVPRQMEQGVLTV